MSELYTRSGMVSLATPRYNSDGDKIGTMEDELVGGMDPLTELLMWEDDYESYDPREQWDAEDEEAEEEVVEVDDGSIDYD